ncbi:hypothetical protein CCP3SC1AL1_110018 [Gammaproteobacteria bacterium]
MRQYEKARGLCPGLEEIRGRVPPVFCGGGPLKARRMEKLIGRTQ